MKIVAFIPARSGSKRLPNKNIRDLAGHPLVAYTIAAALDSGIFDSVICATDDAKYADIARYYGAEVPFLRPQSISGDISPDIEWVKWMLDTLKKEGREYQYFSILRPTCPFRLPQTIERALRQFEFDIAADSLRAVEQCKQHPGKMWILRGERLKPLMPFENNGIPWHSSQYAALPEVFVQNASLEIARTSVVMKTSSISGEVIRPFLTEGLEGFDINLPEDWIYAENYINTGEAVLPKIHRAPYEIS